MEAINHAQQDIITFFTYYDVIVIIVCNFMANYDLNKKTNFIFF